MYYSTSYDNIATINSLTCASVGTNTGTDGTYNPFVAAAASYNGGVCTDGGLKVTDGTNTACVRSGIIDYCKTYISAGFSSTATALTVGCKECASGYQLVNTTSTKTDATAALKPCIATSRVVTGCL